MVITDLDRASMEDFRNMAAALANAEARLAAVEALADEAQRRFDDSNARMTARTGETYDVPAVVTVADLRAVVRADPTEATNASS